MQTDLVFDAIRRGYNELECASNQQIQDYFDDLSADAMIGHVSNIKGIAFEQMVVNSLAEQGIASEVFEATNHPVVDIAILQDSDIAFEAQLKATDSASYINTALDAYPDVSIITTSEVASSIDNAMVINSGIGNDELTASVEVTLMGADSAAIATDSVGDAVGDGLFEAIADVAVPISPIGFGIGLLFGLPF